LVREYFVTTAVVPDVQGRVIEVPVVANRPLKAGDVLFRIDPTPYRYEVERLEAVLAEANSQVAQLEQQLRAAEAATAQARSEVLSSESEFDRQARERLEQSRGVVAQASAEVALARAQEERYQGLVAKKTVSQVDYDRAKRQLESTQAQLRQAQAAERQAAEQLSGGGDRLQSARERLKGAEALEREARVAFESEIGGINPQVRQVTAQLERARWNFEQTTVRAPTDGIVTQLTLRPGMMAVPLPLRPAMTFVHLAAGGQDRALVGAFWQNSLQRIAPGNEAEVIFGAVPGRVFRGKVDSILPVLAQGQLQTGGNLLSVDSASAPERVPVVIRLEDDLSAYNLPVGVVGSAAIYTAHAHHVAVMRKILLRMVSWQNYIFGELH
jgi:multidrug resistance efflux pump